MFGFCGYACGAQFRLHETASMPAVLQLLCVPVSDNTELKIPVVWSVTLVLGARVADVSDDPGAFIIKVFSCLDDSYSEVLRDVSKLLPDYTESHPRRQQLPP